MISKWVKNLGDAAKAREDAQRALDGDKLSSAERKGAELKISTLNREIETSAKRINDELKRSAEERKPVSYPGRLDTIQDRQLQDYCSGVRQTIDRLNHQLMVEGKNSETYYRSLERQRQHALRLQGTAKKNETTLVAEEAKLQKRDADAKKRLEKRQDDMKRLQAELKRLSGERRKFDDERAKVRDIDRQRRKELDTLDREKKQLESVKKTEPRFERRQELKTKIARIEPRIGQLRQLIDEHLKFQLDQYGKLEERIKLEAQQLDKAIDATKQDIELIKKELAEIKKARLGLDDNLKREAKRKVAIGVAVKDVKRAQDQAVRQGVKA